LKIWQSETIGNSIYKTIRVWQSDIEKVLRIVFDNEDPDKFSYLDRGGSWYSLGEENESILYIDDQQTLSNLGLLWHGALDSSYYSVPAAWLDLTLRVDESLTDKEKAWLIKFHVNEIRWASSEDCFSFEIQDDMKKISIQFFYWNIVRNARNSESDSEILDFSLELNLWYPELLDGDRKNYPIKNQPFEWWSLSISPTKEVVNIHSLWEINK